MPQSHVMRDQNALIATTLFSLQSAAVVKALGLGDKVNIAARPLKAGATAFVHLSSVQMSKDFQFCGMLAVLFLCPSSFFVSRLQGPVP